MKIKLRLKYTDGREYIEYHNPSMVPEDIKLQVLRESARRAGNHVIESNWCYEEIAK